MKYPDRCMKHRRTTAYILNVVMKNYKDFVYTALKNQGRMKPVPARCRRCHDRLFAPDMIMCY